MVAVVEAVEVRMVVFEVVSTRDSRKSSISLNFLNFKEV